METSPLKHWARILIITVKEPEWKAVLKAFEINSEHERFKRKNQNRPGYYYYWRKELSLDKEKYELNWGNKFPIEGELYYEVVVTYLGDAGNVNAGIKTCKFIYDFEPDAMFLVGIAGAANKSKLGEIVIGKKIDYYALAKETSEGPESRHETSEGDNDLVETATNMPEPNWKSILQDVTKPEKNLDNPQIYKRHWIAAGELVIADQDKRIEIEKEHGYIKAIAMEDYGIYEAAKIWDKPVPCLSIRAISDLADENKDYEREERQSYAATVAASYAKYYLEHCPIKCEHTIKPLHQPLSQKLTNYYKNKLKKENQFDLENMSKFIDSGELVLFVGPGINLYSASDESKVENPPSEIDIAKALVRECELKRGLEGIGFPCIVCHTESKPPDCPILKITGTSSIENSEECLLSQTQKLAIAQNQKQYLSQYRKNRSDENRVQTFLNEFFRKIYSPNQLHEDLAKLPIKLIVTTNYDCGLERAFKNNEFYVVSYIAEGKDSGRFQYYFHKPKHSDEPKIHVIKNPQDLDFIGSDDHPVILKLYGGALEGHDKENSFAISQEHFLNFLFSSDSTHTKISLAQLLPINLTNKLDNNPLLFIGYSSSDSDLRIILNLFCSGRFRKSYVSNSNIKDSEDGKPKSERKTTPSWIIHQSKPGKFDKAFWDDWVVKLIECPLQTFITELHNHINPIK